ncbi:type II toxin-antitoxin system PemK/MazF family toxin [Promineifilum sp.]|uniref:type II toxin-antitoxin system PemK/MazF family toxin n=1 Tax=Promineifilum sp. TaxID=2664178 RepID=UPI0035B4E383
MTPIEPGDVLLVPFPYTDQSATKQRPAVVLSSKAYNLAHADLILAPITGRFGGEDEVRLIAWQKAGLARPSAVKPLLASFEASLIRRKLGRLEPRDLAAVRSLFVRVLGLSRARSPRAS